MILILISAHANTVNNCTVSARYKEVENSIYSMLIFVNVFLFTHSLLRATLFGLFKEYNDVINNSNHVQSLQ